MGEKEDKLILWLEMEFEEKQKYNGFAGFCRGELFKDKNAFMKEDKDKLKRRLIKEKKFREDKNG